MSSRDQILHRIRRALAVPSTEPPHAPVRGGPRAWLPKVGDSPDDWSRQFAEKAASLKAACEFFPDEESLVSRLRGIASQESWQLVAAHDGASGAIAASLGLPVMKTEAGYDRDQLERADVAFTGCDALVAQTGSVVLSTASAGGRALSILPPHHIVVARRAQLLPDLPAAFAWLARTYGNAWPSMVSFVTGPSRTGDLERILVLGAHGPKKMTVLVH
jgi:L-lactate dehydrogenase complex protein LldG